MSIASRPHHAYSWIFYEKVLLETLGFQNDFRRGYAESPMFSLHHKMAVFFPLASSALSKKMFQNA